MARTPFIAGNWKMNKTVAEGLELVRELKQAVAGINDVDIVVGPTFTTLAAVAEEVKGSNISVSAQNVHWEANGAYTGEISAGMLKEIPVEYVIIGHSERRQYFGETDETVNKRTKAALAAGLKPIVCVGELLEERESGKTDEVVGQQTRQGLAGLSAADMENTVVAYEPVWAIGTGLTASPQQAQDVHAMIRAILREMFGQVADSVRILYGGSVKAANTAELMAGADIDGALVGGASLKAADFAGIITNARG